MTNTPNQPAPELIEQMHPIDLVSRFGVSAHRRFDLSDQSDARWYQDEYNASKAELIRRLEAATPPAPDRPEMVCVRREVLRERIETVWRWLHCEQCGREHANDTPENVALVVNEFMNAIEPALSGEALGAAS